MSFCYNCGSKLNGEERFCAKCGASIKCEDTVSQLNEQQAATLSKENLYEPQSLNNELLSPVKGSQKTFILCNKELVISEDRDTFNGYRAEYRKLAKICADNAVHEYLDKVHNLDDFLEHFMDIYDTNLKMLTQKAIDVLVSLEVYTVTVETFHNQHKDNFHLAIDDYNTILESCRLTEEANNQASTGLTGNFKNFAGNMMSKSKVNNSFVNSFLDGVVDGMMNKAVEEGTKINDAQKTELYGRITPHLLFNRIFNDYWNVYLSLIVALIQNGHNIYFPTIDLEERANNIFQNILNPNFNQDKLIDVLFDIIKINPYNASYYDFLKKRFGETEEVEKIISYFGYNLSQTIYSEEDYPKLEEQKKISTQSNIQMEGTSRTIESNKFKVDKDAVKNIFKSATNSAFGQSIASKFGKKN